MCWGHYWLKAVPAFTVEAGLEGGSGPAHSLRAACLGMLLSELQAQSGATPVLWLLSPVSQ